MIYQFTNELITDGLTVNLIKLFTLLSTEVQDAKTPDISTYKNEERKTIAECLFYVYYQTTATPEDAISVLKLLMECSTSLKQKKKESEIPVDTDVFQICYTLMITLLCLLDVTHELVVPKTGDPSSNPLLNDSAFINTFNTEITKQWELGIPLMCGHF